MKKAIYKSFLLISLGGLAVSINAQQGVRDTLLNKKVKVERDYSPTIKDASKIDQIPSIYEPTISNNDLNFQMASPTINMQNNRLGDSRSADIKTDISYDEKRGYLTFGIGTYGNIESALGYRLVNSDRDKLNLFGDFNATNGKIKYAQKGFLKDREKAKDTKYNLGANYIHKFEPMTLSMEMSYFNDRYNYYGNSFIDPLNKPQDLPNFDKQQQFKDLYFAAGIQSNDDKAMISYDAEFGFNTFKQKYGPAIQNDGLNGWEAYLKTDLDKYFSLDGAIGLQLYGKVQSLDAVQFGLNKETDHRLINFYALPYTKFRGSSWDLKLGVKLGSVLDDKSSFIFAPDVYASIKIAESNRLLLSVTGGVNENTVLQIFDENKFINPVNRVGYSKTLLDANLRFSIGAITGFELQIYGGYKFTQRDHLFTTNNSMNNDDLNTIYSWGNLSNVIYGDIGVSSLGTLAKATFIPHTTLTAIVTAYAYNVKYKNGNLSGSENFIPKEEKAWGKPRFTGELNADVVDVIPKLTLSANYLMALGRDASLNGHLFKMTDIHELNFRSEYRFTDSFSANIKFNNILNNRYERIYGYTLQGINTMIGASLKF